MTEFQLPGLLGEVSSEMERRIDDKSQKLHLQVAPEVGIMTADRDLVRRILENLIDNAYKYGPRNATIALEASILPAESGVAERVELRVRDQGEGIPLVFRQKIFEKYARVGGRSAHEVRNSHGLGLVFCRRAVEVHGGEIWVEENGAHGKGSCFRVRLALRPGVARGQQAPIAGEQPSVAGAPANDSTTTSSAIAAG